MENIGDSVAWPSRDPQWLQKVLIIGLISIIPIVGSMNAYGWLLAGIESLRAGRSELPAAGFDHLGRGAGLYLVLLVWALIPTFGILAILIIGSALAAVGGAQNSGAVTAVALLLDLVAGLIGVVSVLAYYAVQVPLILATERGGVAGGLNFRGVLGLATANPSRTLVAGLMSLVASLIGGLGVVLCIVGAYFTNAYSYAILAAVASHFERGMAAPPIQPPPMAPAT